MITKEAKDKMIAQTTNIFVIPLNMDAFNKDIDTSIKRETEKAGNSSFAPKIEPDQYFGLKDTYGVIKGTNILIDTECVGEVDENPRFSIYRERKDENGKIKSFSLFPAFSTKINIKDLLREYGQDEISLKDFMGDRFCYNDRVQSNMREIIKELKNDI